MTHAERYKREQDFKHRFEQEMPDFARMCNESVDEILIHQDGFAADYQESEFLLLGKAIKYAGLLGKGVHVIGRNADTLVSPAVQ
jgi:hypothetical protein